MADQTTIPESDGRIQSAVGATPSTGPFAVPWPFFSLDDVVVTLTSDAGTITPQVRGADYDLEATANGDGIYPSGVVTFLSPIANTTITRYRDTSIERLSNLPLAGFMDRGSLNGDLNREVAATQDLVREARRTLRVDPSDIADAPQPIPTRQKRANKLLGFDVAGEPVASHKTMQELEDFRFTNITVIGTKEVDVVSLADPAFGAVPDGHELTDGSIDPDSTDNTDALDMAIDVALATGYRLDIPKGDWVIRRGDVISKVNASGLWINGKGEDSNLMFTEPLNGHDMIHLGDTGRGTGECTVFPIDSTLFLVDGATQADLVVRLNSTFPLREGMAMCWADPNQPIRYHAGSPGIAAHEGEMIFVDKILDGEHVQLRGIPENNYGPGTQVGYIHNPVRNLKVTELRFTYDKINSQTGGVSSVISLSGHEGLFMEGLHFHNVTSRALTISRGYNFLIQGLFPDIVAGGSLMTVADLTSHGVICDITGNGGQHFVSLGGDNDNWGTCWVIVRNLLQRHGEGTCAETHWAARDTLFDGIVAVGQTSTYEVDGDPDTVDGRRATGLTLRGYRRQRAVNCNMKRKMMAYRLFNGTGGTLDRCNAEDCGYGWVVTQMDQAKVIDSRCISPRYWGLSSTTTFGPVQGHPMISKMTFRNLEVEGSPSQAPYQITANQITVNDLETQNWQVQNVRHNGAPAQITWGGALSGAPPYHRPNSDEELHVPWTAFPIKPAGNNQFVNYADDSQRRMRMLPDGRVIGTESPNLKTSRADASSGSSILDDVGGAINILGTAIPTAVTGTSSFTRRPRTVVGPASASVNLDYGTEFVVPVFLADRTHVTIQGGIDTYMALGSHFVGLGPLGGVGSGAFPGGRTNMLGICMPTNGANWLNMNMDAAGGADTTSLGTGFETPVSSAAWFELMLWWAAGAPRVWRQFVLFKTDGTIAVSQRIITTHLPDPLQPLFPIWVGNTRTGVAPTQISAQSFVIEK